MNKLLLLITVVICVSACSHTSPSLVIEEGTPTQSMKNAEIVSSDSGIVRMKMRGVQIDYYNDENQTQVFRHGMTASFFDKNGKLISIVSADSAINHQKTELMELHGNVVIKTLTKKETVYTEELFWNQKTRRLKSTKHIKQVKPDGVMEGDGFESDDDMENFRIIRPRGVQTF